MAIKLYDLSDPSACSACVTFGVLPRVTLHAAAGLAFLSWCLASPLAAAPKPNVVTLVPSSLDLPGHLSAADLRTALATAGERWSYPQVPCTNLELRVAAPAAYRRVEVDGRNLFVFRSQKWCHNQQCGARSTFPRFAAAMTTVHGEGSDRGITEADVELNGVWFDWSIDDASGTATSRSVVPLIPVLVHEIGHVLNFRDTCGSRHATSGHTDCPPTELESVMLSGSGRADLTAWDIERVRTRFPRMQGSTSDESLSSEHPGMDAWPYGLVLAAGAALMVANACLRRRRREPRR